MLKRIAIHCPQHLSSLQIQENNQTILVRTISFKELSTSPDNKEGFHWIGVLLCFGAASLGGLSNVATNYLKVCFKYIWTTLDL